MVVLSQWNKGVCAASHQLDTCSQGPGSEESRWRGESRETTQALHVKSAIHVPAHRCTSVYENQGCLSSLPFMSFGDASNTSPEPEGEVNLSLSQTEHQQSVNKLIFNSRRLTVTAGDGVNPEVSRNPYIFRTTVPRDHLGGMMLWQTDN